METQREEPLENLTDEELQARVADFEAYFDFEQGTHGHAEDIRKLFEFIRTLIFIGEVADAAQVLDAAEGYLDQALEAAPEDEDLLELKVEWNRLAMRFVMSEVETYVEYPFYRNILSICEGRGGKFEVYYWKACIGLLHNYEIWKQQGGNLRSLPPHDRKWLEELGKNLVPEIQQRIESWQQDGDYARALPLKRSLGVYWLQSGNVDAGKQVFDELAEAFPHHPEATQADVADIWLEIGTYLAQLGYYDEAHHRLEKALEQYRALGEDYEIYTAQAETWLEELNSLRA